MTSDEDSLYLKGPLQLEWLLHRLKFPSLTWHIFFKSPQGKRKMFNEILVLLGGLGKRIYFLIRSDNYCPSQCEPDESSRTDRKSVLCFCLLFKNWETFITNACTHFELRCESWHRCTFHVVLLSVNVCRGSNHLYLARIGSTGVDTVYIETPVPIIKPKPPRSQVD